MKNLLKRLRNPGTIVAIVGTAGLLLTQFGIKIDLEWLDSTVKIACSLGVLLGILNNPQTPGIDNPTKG